MRGGEKERGRLSLGERRRGHVGSSNGTYVEAARDGGGTSESGTDDEGVDVAIGGLSLKPERPLARKTRTRERNASEASLALRPTSKSSPSGAFPHFALAFGSGFPITGRSTSGSTARLHSRTLPARCI